MSGGWLAAFLGGALLASAVMNVYLWQKSDLAHTEELGPGLRAPHVPLETLELNQTQTSALSRLGSEKALAAKDLRHRIVTKTGELQAALGEEEMDTAEVAILAEELRQLRREEVDQQVGILLAVRELLTPYQTRLLYQALYPEITPLR
jgi:Spy/CpxP family protein refolding chaperone